MASTFNRYAFSPPLMVLFSLRRYAIAIVSMNGTFFGVRFIEPPLRRMCSPINVISNLQLCASQYLNETLRVNSRRRRALMVSISCGSKGVCG